MENKHIRGAEVIAKICYKMGIRYSFGYPGTSELSICDEFSKYTYYKNARGDKEAAFLAAGSSLLKKANGVSVLHGARGAGNALGAIADINRNEIATLMIVGLPSRASAQYLPPHGDEFLVKGLECFAKKVVSFENYDESFSEEYFMEKIKEAIDSLLTVPYGPIVVAVPQNVLEDEWISNESFERFYKSLVFNTQNKLDTVNVDKLIKKIEISKNICILIDDYYFKYDEEEIVLKMFAEKISAKVMQIRYRRGPMLFRRMNIDKSEYFIGWYDPSDKMHRRLMNECDLLITIEDRNMYERVMGKFSEKCSKVAINSSKQKVLKNGYICEDTDVIVEGNPVDVLKYVTSKVNIPKVSFKKDEYLNRENNKIYKDRYYDMRLDILNIVNTVISMQKDKLIVDDSQMFGGIISSVYDKLDNKVKIFGDHGAFVGGGMAISTGLAVTLEDDFVICLVGDQGFSNGVQVLNFCQENHIPIVFIVCNNGESVSLHKQLGDDIVMKNIMLNNCDEFSICKIAEGFNLTSIKFSYNEDNLEDFIEESKKCVNNMMFNKKSLVMELKVPSDIKYWSGVWSSVGYEENK